MYKFSTLLIYFILAAVTKSDPKSLTKDQVLDQAYEIAKTHYADGKALTAKHLENFVTEKHANKIKEFFTNNNYTQEERDDISLNTFKFIMSNLNLIEEMREALSVSDTKRRKYK